MSNFLSEDERHRIAGLNFLNSDPIFCPKSTQQIEHGFKLEIILLVVSNNILSTLFFQYF